MQFNDELSYDRERREIDAISLRSFKPANRYIKHTIRFRLPRDIPNLFPVERRFERFFRVFTSDFTRAGVKLIENVYILHVKWDNRTRMFEMCNSSIFDTTRERERERGSCSFSFCAVFIESQRAIF